MLITILLSFPVTAVAQQRPARNFSENGVLVTATGTIKYNVYDDYMTSSSHNEVIIQSGVSVPGYGCRFNVPYGDHAGVQNFVIVGRNLQGSGILEHYTRNDFDSNYTLASQSLIAPSDFTGVAYDQYNGLLYLLDANFLVIRRGVWDGAQSLSQVVFPVWADVNDSLTLVNAEDSIIKRVGAKINIRRLQDSLGPLPGSIGAIFQEVLGVVVVSAPSNAMAVIKVHADPTSVKDQGNTIRVIGFPGTTAEVVDKENELVIGSGVVPLSGPNEVTITTSTPFVIGKGYFTRESGSSLDYDELWFECIRREGFSEAIGTGISMSPIIYDNRLYPGGIYRTTIPITADPPPASHLSYPGWLALAADTVARENVGVIIPYPDPVTGPNSLINPALRLFLFTPSALVTPATGQGQIYYQFDIPNDPTLVGGVVLSQFALNVNEELKLSEIGGALVHAGPLAPPAAAATAGGGQQSAAATSTFILSDLSEFNIVPPELDTCPKPDERKLEKLIKEGRKDAAKGN